MTFKSIHLLKLKTYHMEFFRKLINNLTSLLITPIKVLSKLGMRFSQLKDYFIDFINHFKVLREANISLGKYHLMEGNLKDANIRFWLTNKFFAKEDAENKYWHAWYYILSKNFKLAEEKLANNAFDQIGLHNYVGNISNITTIPDSIDEEYTEITSKQNLSRYFSAEKNVFDSLTSAMMTHIPQQSWPKTKGKYTILEIKSYPFMMFDLIPYLPEFYQIDTLNFKSSQTELAEEYDDKHGIYNKITTIQRNDFKSYTEVKYEAVIAIDSFSYSSNLLDNFKIIKSILTKDGFAAIALPKGLSTKLEPENNHFTYTEDYIKSQLELADFKSISITSIKTLKKFEYYMVIAK